MKLGLALCKVKKTIFIGQVMNVVSVWVHRHFWCSLSRSHLLSISIFLFYHPSCWFFLLISLSHSLVPPLSVTLFLPFPSIWAFCPSHTGSIVIDFVSLSPSYSPSYFLPLCLPVFLFAADQLMPALSWRWPVGWARGCNTGHGSCLSSPLVSCVAASGSASLPLSPSVWLTSTARLSSSKSWSTPAMGLKTLCLTLHIFMPYSCQLSSF